MEAGFELALKDLQDFIRQGNPDGDRFEFFSPRITSYCNYLTLFKCHFFAGQNLGLLCPLKLNEKYGHKVRRK